MSHQGICSILEQPVAYQIGKLRMRMTTWGCDGNVYLNALPIAVELHVPVQHHLLHKVGLFKFGYA